MNSPLAQFPSPPLWTLDGLRNAEPALGLALLTVLAVVVAEACSACCGCRGPAATC